MVFFAWVAVVFALLAGCQQSSGCPPQMEPVPGHEKDANLWCRARDRQRVEWTEHHPNTRKPRRHCVFQQGVAAGEFVASYASGQRWIAGEYHGGRKQGLWVQWDEAGQKVADARYNDGKLVAGAPVGLPAECETLKP